MNNDPPIHGLRSSAAARRGRFGYWGAAQLALIVLGPALAAIPQGDSGVLIAPLTTSDRNATVRWALAAGATPIAAGPYAGSYIVQGSFAALLMPAIEHGALIINARFAGCGAPLPEDG